MCAKRTGKPYYVKELAYAGFLDLKCKGHEYTGIKITEIVMYQLRKGNASLFYKISYEEEVFIEAKATRGKLKQAILISCYAHKIKIAEKRR